jgi:hypothetical protein
VIIRKERCWLIYGGWARRSVKNIRGLGCIYWRRKEKGVVCKGVSFLRYVGLYCIIKIGISRGEFY